MACIGTVSGTLAMTCGAPNPLFNRIQGAKLINAADIASYTIDPNDGSAKITRVANKAGYEVTTVNNALTLAVGLKSQDITPGAYDVTIEFKIFASPDAALGVVSLGVPMGVVNAVARAELVIAVDHGNGVYRVYGLGVPLICLDCELDSTGDGCVKVSYGVEDWQVGTTVHRMTKADYDALSTPAVAPKSLIKEKKRK